MKYKKMTALALALSVLLVCGVTAAFATEPVDDIDDPALTDTEPVETEPMETEPAESEPVASGFWPSSIEIVTDNGVIVFDTSDPHFLDKLIKVPSTLCGTQTEIMPASSAAEPECTHPNLAQGKPVKSVYCKDGDEFGHTRIVNIGRSCPDCPYDIFDLADAIVTRESHTFGQASYVGSNHTAADYAQHYLIFSKECVDCCYSYTYETWSGCRKGNCVDFNSVTPEPEVNSTEPVEPDGTVGE